MKFGKVALFSATALGLAFGGFASFTTVANTTTAFAKTSTKSAAAKKAAAKKAAAKKAAAKKAAEKKAAAKKTAEAVSKSSSASSSSAASSPVASSTSASASSVASTKSSSTTWANPSSQVQTTLDSQFNIVTYDNATGGTRVASSGSADKGLLATITGRNSNVNWSNATIKFDSDPTMIGTSGQAIPKDTLMTALKNAGAMSFYNKITPTFWKFLRTPGGFVDNLDKTGLFVKFNLDADSLPQVVTYGSQLKLSYRVDASSLYVYSGNGYAAYPIRNASLRSFLQNALEND